MKRTLPLLACISALAGTTAQAEGDWIIGLLATGGQSPYVGGKNEAELLPYIAYETDRFYIGVDELSYDVIDTDQLDVAVRFEPRFSPDFPDTALFEGLERDDAFELGFAATYDFGVFYSSASLQGDVAGAHDGMAGSVAVGYEAQLGFAMLDFSAGVKLRDAKLNNFLYGVAADEATANRAAFNMENTANAFAEVTTLIPLSETMFLYGEVSYEDLGDAFNSPLVDQENKTDITLGLVFQY